MIYVVQIFVVREMFRACDPSTWPPDRLVVDELWTPVYYFTSIGIFPAKIVFDHEQISGSTSATRIF